MFLICSILVAVVGCLLVIWWADTATIKIQREYIQSLENLVAAHKRSKDISDRIIASQDVRIEKYREMERLYKQFPSPQEFLNARKRIKSLSRSMRRKHL